MATLGFLFNCDENDRTKPDPNYAEEYQYLMDRKIHVFLFDFSEIDEDGELLLERATEKTHIVYRGWMLNEEQYDRLYERLKEKNYHMIVDEFCYRECHYLDYWYPKVQRLTAKSVYSHGLCSDKEIERMLRQFGNKSLIVKDYVKSRHHEWYDSCFIEDASNTEDAMRVIHNFIEKQGDNFSGGLVLREYLDLITNGVHFETHEPIVEDIKIVCYKEDPICYISYYTGHMVQLDRQFNQIIDRCSAVIESTFYVLDIAKKADGSWTLLDVGDGQVAQLKGYDVMKFYDCFLSLLVRDYDIYSM